MIVNLFDATFGHDVCSTGWATPAQITYTRGQMAHAGVTLYTDGQIYQPPVLTVRSPVKLGWLHEPPELIPDVYRLIDARLPDLNAVLTYHPDLLGRDGFVFMPYAGCWIDRAEWCLQHKTRLCSMLVGAKTATSGHRLRQACAEAVAGRVDFYGVRGEPTDYSPATKLRVNSTYAFSVVTETQMLGNLFTEWLLDCFAVGTIPVYAGAPNLGEFFDARGVLAFETPEQCAALVAGLSWDLYETLKPYAAANLARLPEYAVAEDWMYAHILKAYDA